jgi:hypothetical protein
MLQDNKGFMWFATWNGLNRYDGYDFAIFKSLPGDGNNLASDRIRNIIMGEDGNIYCSISSRVWRFNLKTYMFEELDPEFITLYYGCDVAADEAEHVGNLLSTHFPESELSVVDGGQPVYYYMISVE